MIPIRDLNPTKTFPIVTAVLIIINLGVFAFVQPRDSGQADSEFLYKYATIACEVVSGEPVSHEEVNNNTCSKQSERGVFADKSIIASIFASMFLHASWLHVIFNVWFLWIFGNNVEEAYGSVRYLIGYLIAGIIATLGFVATNAASVIPLVGASGAVAGVLGAYLVLFPKHKITSLVFVFFVPIPAFIFLALWFAGQFGQQDPGIAWQAHVAGFLVGVLATAIARPSLMRRLARIHSPREVFGFPSQVR
ncbi:MAG TPA: rhomboid family intramembrane serine protease [Actinobacteria bacterium]|nr:rhomboid protease GluP [bacterium BMS3Bbin02]HDL42249.1 rhomboid family intramembrane serine protease [Actinomycetota bacterium]